MPSANGHGSKRVILYARVSLRDPRYQQPRSDTRERVGGELPWFGDEERGYVADLARR